MEIVLTVSDQAWGGKQRYMQQVAEGLTQFGHSVTVIAEDGSAMLEACRAAGLPSVGVAGFDTEAATDAVSHVLREHKPWVICATGRADTAVVQRARKRVDGIAALCMFRHSAFPLGTTDEVRELLEGADLVFATSREQRQRQFGALIAADVLGEDQVEVLTSGVDDGLLSALDAVDRDAARTQLGVDRDQFAFLVLARLAWEKGIDRVIEAFARLNETRDRVDAVLLIAGDGPLEAELRSQVAELGIDGHVRFLGHQPVVAALIAASDAVVLASTVPETGPLALKEAMAGGRPVIASAQGGIPEFVDDEQHGLLIVDDEDLWQAMRRLATDRSEGQALGAAGRDRILGGHLATRRLEYLAHRLDLLAIEQIDPELTLREIAWGDVRLRDETAGGFIFVPRTSQIMELGAEPYAIVRKAVEANDPSLLAHSAAVASLARSLYSMGALTRPQARPPQRRGSRAEVLGSS
ncbi:glycosyltransferase family 4 protein [Nocardia sp. NPDC051570]|uniref:glycosyltransferase family 4 protein n=1 Tax=Nocardia sp. NPDC051570 TaxID=3364324 RepID=UPI00378DE19C